MDALQPMFGGLPWRLMRILAENARRAWKPPKSGLPKLQEECAEVIVAVNKFGYGELTAKEVASELADNLLMLVQAALIIGEELVREAVLEKMQRLGRRLAEHSAGCPNCEGTGVVGSLRCPNCFPEVPTDFGVSHGRVPPLPPSDEWLHGVFRDFAEGTPVKEYRRRVYERCVGHYLQAKGA